MNTRELAMNWWINLSLVKRHIICEQNGLHILNINNISIVDIEKFHKLQPDTCNKCGGNSMLFKGESTQSRTGTAQLVICYKCINCGHSWT